MGRARSMWALLASVALTSAAMGDDKSDDYKKLLVGKWRAEKVDPNTLPLGAIVEFTKDGTITITAKKNGKDAVISGSYTLSNGVISTLLKFEGKPDKKPKMVIKKLTSDDFVVTTEDEKLEGDGKVTFIRTK